ncbi:MAG: recombinase family protein [Pyrobaculum sp.]
MDIPAVTYVRVSTEGQNPESQVEYLERWAASHGLYIVRHYVDRGVSGATPPWERPEFRLLMREVPQLRPRPKVLLIYEVSRLTRNFRQLFTLLELVERKLGLWVVSTGEKEQILQTLDETYREFLRAALAFAAAMEREFIRQRTRAARERLKAEGKLQNDLDRALKRDPQVVEKAAALYRQGATLGEIAKTLGLSKYGVKKALAKAGLYRPTPHTCPICFSRMTPAGSSIKIENRIKIIEILRCKKCGYEEKREPPTAT